MLKVKDKGVITLYVLNQLNGVPIKNVNILEEAFKHKNNGNLDGSNAVYVPINYTGSNIANNSFLPYSLTDEELDNVTRHIQATVGKDAVQNTAVDAFSVDEFNDEMFNSMGSTDVVPLAPETSGGSALGGLLKPFQAEDSTSTNVPTAAPLASNGKIEVVGRYTDAEVKANPNKIYVFGDNVQRVGTGGQAQIRNNPNAMGIATKIAPSMADNAFMTDNSLTTNKAIIDADIAKIKATNKIVVFPKDGLGTGLAKLQEKAPQTYDYLKQRLLQEFGFNNDTGAIQESSPKSLENAKPNVTLNVGTSAEEKSITNIAELRNKLISDAMFANGKTEVEKIREIQRISNLNDSELVNEYNKKLKC
jgi:hypothetical protein